MVEVSHPLVPPRPARPAKETKQPTIPPRPAKKIDRSKSPSRDTYSPLNDSPFAVPGSPNPTGMYSYGNNSSTSLHVPLATPIHPTAVLPTIGQEGSEYANIDALAPVEIAKPVFKQHLKDEVNGARPGMKQRFPSSDIWEDAPDSVHLSTELTTPEEADEPNLEPSVPLMKVRSATPRSTPRKLSRDLNSPSKPIFPSHLREEMGAARPNVKQRFPSNDIWEDSPDSVHLSAEVSSPGEPADEEITSPVDEPKPEPELAPSAEKKAAPVVPPRPNRGKLTSIKAGFLSDLNNRLGAGPPVPKALKKVEEPEEAKAPLGDARKGRAKGPARRKPAAAVTSDSGSGPSADAAYAVLEHNLRISRVVSLWTISENGALHTVQTASDIVKGDSLSQKTTAADSEMSNELHRSQTAKSTAAESEASNDLERSQTGTSMLSHTQSNAAKVPLPESEVATPKLEKSISASSRKDSGLQVADMVSLEKEGYPPDLVSKMSGKEDAKRTSEAEAIAVEEEGKEQEEKVEIVRA